MADERAGGAGTGQPYEVLERAANLLEERAGKATEGPWTVGNVKDDVLCDINGVPVDPVTCDVMTSDGEYVTASPDGHPGACVREDDALWMATVDPAVATPLVALLRSTSQYARALAVLRGPVEEDMHVEHALTFARMVLGQAAEAAGIPVVIHREDT